MKNKYSLKDIIDYFFSFLHKNIIHDKIILFHAAFLVQKNTMRTGYAERSTKWLWLYHKLILISEENYRKQAQMFNQNHSLALHTVEIFCNLLLKNYWT